MASENKPFFRIEPRKVTSAFRYIVLDLAVADAQHRLGFSFTPYDEEGLGSGVECWLGDRSGNVFFMNALRTEGPIQVDLWLGEGVSEDSGLLALERLVQLLGPAHQKC
jgi:hypothetical protein